MDLETLYDELYSNESTKDPKVFTKKVEAHVRLLDSDFSQLPESILDKGIRIIADYAHSLAMLERHSKSIPMNRTAIRLIEDRSKVKNMNPFSDPFYETLLFDYGMSNYYLQKYSDSKRTFKVLVNQFPENTKYLSWHSGLQTRTFKGIESVTTGVIVVLLLLYVIADEYINEYNLAFSSVLGLVLALGIGAFIMRKVKERKLKVLHDGYKI